MLSRAAHYPGVTDTERQTLIKLGAPRVSPNKALELVERAQQLGLEFRHAEAEEIIDALLSGDISGVIGT